MDFRQSSDTVDSSTRSVRHNVQAPTPLPDSQASTGQATVHISQFSGVTQAPSPNANAGQANGDETYPLQQDADVLRVSVLTLPDSLAWLIAQLRRELATAQEELQRLEGEFDVVLNQNSRLRAELGLERNRNRLLGTSPMNTLGLDFREPSTRIQMVQISYLDDDAPESGNETPESADLAIESADEPRQRIILPHAHPTHTAASNRDDPLATPDSTSRSGSSGSVILSHAKAPGSFIPFSEIQQLDLQDYLFIPDMKRWQLRRDVEAGQGLPPLWPAEISDASGRVPSWVRLLRILMIMSTLEQPEMKDQYLHFKALTNVAFAPADHDYITQRYAVLLECYLNLVRWYKACKTPREYVADYLLLELDKLGDEFMEQDTYCRRMSFHEARALRERIRYISNDQNGPGVNVDPNVGIEDDADEEAPNEENITYTAAELTALRPVNLPTQIEFDEDAPDYVMVHTHFNLGSDLSIEEIWQQRAQDRERMAIERDWIVERTRRR